MAGIDITFALERWNAFQRPEDFIPSFRNMAIGGIVRRLRGEVKRRTPKDTTALVQSWQDEIGDDYISYFTDVPYAQDLEEGLYPMVGPRTKRGDDGKIYSSQAVGGILGPLEDDAGLLDEIMNTLIEQIVGNLEV